MSGEVIVAPVSVTGLVAAGCVFVAGKALEGVVGIVEDQIERAREKARQQVREVEAWRNEAGRMSAAADEALNSFRESMRAQDARITAATAMSEATRDRAARLASRARFYADGELLKDGRLRKAFSNLYEALDAKGQPLVLDTVEALGKRLDSLIHKANALLAGRAAALETERKVCESLAGRGYRCLQPFPENPGSGGAEARFAPPGDHGLLRVRVKADGRIFFRLCHRSKTGLNTLTRAELRSFRKQEQQVCRDTTGVVRDLVRHGLRYALAHERPVPEDRIDIATMEDAGEIRRQGWRTEPKAGSVTSAEKRKEYNDLHR